MSVKTAFRDLAKMFHPDVASGDTRAMQALNELYEAAKAGDGGRVQQASEEIHEDRKSSQEMSYADKQVATARHMAIVKTATEIDLNVKQLERMHEEDFNDYIRNMNEQAQALYYARLADALEDQRNESMAEQAAAQNKVYEQRAQEGRAAKAGRAANVRANGGQAYRENGMWVDTDGSYCSDSDLSDYGVFS